MALAPFSLKKDYWLNFDVTNHDLEFIYNYLLEVEQPQTTRNLVKALASERIRVEKISLEKQQRSGGNVYYPKDHFQTGQVLQFPQFDWQSGTILSARPGQNPEIGSFEVVEVELLNGDKKVLAANLQQHVLNQPVKIDLDNPLLNEKHILETYGEDLEAIIEDALAENEHLVRIAGRWFPRALLVDINVGHLNLAEAVLDMMGGGPLDTQALMEQIDMPSDADANLNEFSLNLAMQEDKRFDEVGPTGKVLWYLHRLEPQPVQDVPVYLRYNRPDNYDPSTVSSYFNEIGSQIVDELESGLNSVLTSGINETTLSLIYPHWRVGTLPLAGNLAYLFPTALESPRIQFTFVDGANNEKFSGWVVRPYQYVYGLKEWYLSQGLIPGSIIRIQRGKNPGEIIIRSEKKRPSREWVRTAMIGSDGGVVFSMLKHNVSSAVDERMGFVVSNTDLLDETWERGRHRGPMAITIRLVMRELAKLSHQNHVHAQELYAGVNLLRRCPPGVILATLFESPWAKHLGNLYFRLEDAPVGDVS